MASAILPDDRPGGGWDKLTHAVSRIWHSIRWHLLRMPQRVIELGLPPHLLGWRWIRRETLAHYAARDPDGCSIEEIDPPRTLDNPLPLNVADRAILSRDDALWGYSMHDVPQRESAPTLITRLNGCRIFFSRAGDRDVFFPAIVTRDGRALTMREMTYRPPHGGQIRDGNRPLRLARATWILERSYDNHSHWLTAHLPKLLLLKERGALDHVLMPLHRTSVMDASMRMVGIDPEAFPTFDPSVSLEIDDLTLVTTDRFRPALLRSVRDAFAHPSAAAAHARVFISRAGSRGRHLLNEDALWPIMERAGFVRIRMEDLTFAEQVALMQRTRILVAPHGAGLTNMLFCPEGGHVVEIADPGFPNPNFYALASATGLNYWHVEGEGVGTSANPLDKDLRVAPTRIEQVLARIA